MWITLDADATSTVLYRLLSVPWAKQGGLLEEGCSKPILLCFCFGHHSSHGTDQMNLWCDPPRLFLRPFGCFAIAVTAQPYWNRYYSPDSVSQCMICISVPDTGISEERYWGAVFLSNTPTFPLTLCFPWIYLCGILQQMWTHSTHILSPLWVSQLHQSSWVALVNLLLSLRG